MSSPYVCCLLLIAVGLVLIAKSVGDLGITHDIGLVMLCEGVVDLVTKRGCSSVWPVFSFDIVRRVR